MMIRDKNNIFERVENFHADLAWNYPEALSKCSTSGRSCNWYASEVIWLVVVVMGGKDRTCQCGSVPVLLLKADCYNQRPFFVSKVLKSISYLFQQKFMADVHTGTVESVKGFV